jgi:hypothetical protein
MKNPKWHKFEAKFESSTNYSNPLQEICLTVKFTSPSGKEQIVDGFWDGGLTWRVRFMPNEEGQWLYSTICSDKANSGLNSKIGEFEVSEQEGETVFEKHGPIQLSSNRRYLVHEDSTPFFWMGDTVWCGPMMSTDEEWSQFLKIRKEQGFNTILWVTTQWIASPKGDRDGDLAFEGHEKIRINPVMFQKLDKKLDAMNAGGMLGVPVLAWAAEWGTDEVMSINPGLTLPEDQVILLERYMVARWGANFTAWILNGDGYYVGRTADRWKRIGRAVFGRRPHSPVMMHTNGTNLGCNLFLNEFQEEEWLDIIGYQSGHGGFEKDWNWFVFGPPATDWVKQPFRPFINLEPCYENHRNFSKGLNIRFDSEDIRFALYTSLLISPTAGVTYGGHGVWGWDDGVHAPLAHDLTGVPLAWKEALHMPVANQIRYLLEIFNEVEWWKLKPAQLVIGDIPWNRDSRHVPTAVQTEDRSLILVYSPDGKNNIELMADKVGKRSKMIWFDPRTGDKFEADLKPNEQKYIFDKPSDLDWVLLLFR